MNLIGNHFGGVSPIYTRPQVPVAKELPAVVPTPAAAPEVSESVSFSQAATSAPALPTVAPELAAAPEQFIAAPRQNPENMAAGSGIIAGHQTGSLLMMDEPVAAAGAISDHNVGFTSPQQLKQLRGMAQALAATHAAGLEIPKSESQMNKMDTMMNGQMVTMKLAQCDGEVQVEIHHAPGTLFSPEMFGHSGRPRDTESVSLPSGSNVEMEWMSSRTTGPTLSCFFPKEDLQALIDYGHHLNNSAV